MSQSPLHSETGEKLASVVSHHNLNGFCKRIAINLKNLEKCGIDEKRLKEELSKRDDGMRGHPTRASAIKAFKHALAACQKT